MTSNETTRRSVLNRDAIASLLAGDLPLLQEYLDLKSQLQPNGFDVTVHTVASYPSSTGPGAIGFSDAERVLPECTEMDFGRDGWLSLLPGHYLVTFNEVVNLPRWLMLSLIHI